MARIVTSGQGDWLKNVRPRDGFAIFFAELYLSPEQLRAATGLYRD